jgi:sulfite exporter TauE/SafE
VLEIWLAFSAGLAGSGHCLGMCGGIVTALALSTGDKGAAERFLFNLLYHAGRITTYTLLGLLAGLAVRAGVLDEFRSWSKWLFLAANLLVLLMGLFTMIGIRSLGVSALDGCGWGLIRRLLARVKTSRSVLAAIPAGLLMGLIPCGLVYGVLISAATSASSLQGGSMMLAFGAGTLPVLMAYGQVAATLSALGRGIFQRVMGAVVALLGGVGVWKALVTLGLV